MNKLYNLGALSILLVFMTFFTGCSDKFLENKQNYDNYTDEIYNDYEGALERVNYLYYCLLPSSTASIGYDTPSAGTSDINSRSTEEYGGMTSDNDQNYSYVSPGIVWDNTNVPDYIYREVKNVSPYGRIRECNMVIEGVSNGTLSDSQKKTLLGQAYFFRAWCYYRLVKIYGGVPIIDKVQNVGNDYTSLTVPRSTTKECIDFICSDLDLAASYLPTNWSTTSSSDYGRVTAGTALALQGRARLLYASPLFNRTDDATRWKAAYESNKAAIAKLTEGGFGLAYVSNPGTNASGWAKMFSDYTSSEAVFVTLYNTVKTSSGTSYDKNNGWEQSIRPANASGSGGKSTTAQMIDVFPMADGKKPATATSASSLLSSSSYAYDSQRFFVNRDPRFYRTFAFPGERWAFSGDLSGLNSTVSYPYSQGSTYSFWGYCWYDNATNKDADDKSGFAADGLATSNKSVLVRKRTDDYDVNTSSLYIYDTTNKFGLSAAPYMEMRYAEVLLNFAESACGVGGATEMNEAVDALKQIRARVGYTSSNNYGLDADLNTNRAKLFAAILYERQIELAYEGKRFDDMRRWLLWDGGVGQDALKSTWKLTGFSGNTCTYLGVQPLNGTRRTGIEIRVSDARGIATMANGSDPLVAQSVSRPTPLNLKTDATTWLLGDGSAIDKLYNFYAQNLYRKTTRIDGDLTYTITFQPKYYLIGFKTNMQKMNPTLKQTVGWQDLNNGNADGTFDPLAE